MVWLALGAAYSVVYAVLGAYLRPFPNFLPWFRIVALLIPPLVGILVIAKRRHDWIGCQWLFWATIALGLSTTAIGIVGWTVDEVLLEHETSVARLAHGVCAVRIDCPPVCDAGSASPRDARIDDSQHGCGHRRHRRDDRVPLFALRGRFEPVAAHDPGRSAAAGLASRTATAAGVRGPLRRGIRFQSLRVGGDLPASCGRLAGQLRDSDDQQPRDHAGPCTGPAAFTT